MTALTARFALSSCSSPFETVAEKELTSLKLFTLAAFTCFSSPMNGACWALIDAVRAAAAAVPGRACFSWLRMITITC